MRNLKLIFWTTMPLLLLTQTTAVGQLPDPFVYDWRCTPRDTSGSGWLCYQSTYAPNAWVHTRFIATCSNDRAMEVEASAFNLNCKYPTAIEAGSGLNQPEISAYSASDTCLPDYTETWDCNDETKYSFGGCEGSC